MRASSIAAAFLLAGIWTGAITVASAHDAGVAAVKIVHRSSGASSGAWAFELQAPLSALDRAMRRFHVARSHELDDLDENDARYKELLIEYVKASLELEPGAADDEGSPVPVPRLGEGRMKLGDHVSVLIFAIEDMPATVDELTVRLSYMADEAGQRNVLWLVDGKRSERHVLGADETFTLVDSHFFRPEIER